MRLSHFPKGPGAECFRFDPTRTYEQDTSDGSHYRKPSGFWVSVDGPDDWAEWCVGNECFTSSIPLRHQVTLNAHRRRLLILSTEAAIMHFTYTYGIRDLTRRTSRRFDHRIDWARVAAEYDGIIIAPYCGAARWTYDWYYPWDAASGCIWNLDAIAAVEPAPLPQLLTGAENETRQRIDRILAVCDRDPDAAHSAEDLLLWDIVETFAPPRVKTELTRLAVADFPRWTA